MTVVSKWRMDCLFEMMIGCLFEIKMTFFSRGLIVILKWKQGIFLPLLTFEMIVIFLVIWKWFCGENDSHFETIVTAKNFRNFCHFEMRVLFYCFVIDLIFWTKIIFFWTFLKKSSYLKPIRGCAYPIGTFYIDKSIINP